MNHLHSLAQKLEDLIFHVADNNFFFNDLEECDQVSVYCSASLKTGLKQDFLFTLCQGLINLYNKQPKKYINSYFCKVRE